MSDYPEHEKVKALDGDNEVVGDFLEWLSAQRLVLCRWHDADDDAPSGYYPAGMRMQALLAKYFGIDESKLEDEKRQMLDAIRLQQEALNR